MRFTLVTSIVLAFAATAKALPVQTRDADLNVGAHVDVEKRSNELGAEGTVRISGRDPVGIDGRLRIASVRRDLLNADGTLKITARNSDELVDFEKRATVDATGNAKVGTTTTSADGSVVVDARSNTLEHDPILPREHVPILPRRREPILP